MSGSTSTLRYDHIVVVVEENHTYGEIVGNSAAPYMNYLATHGALLSGYSAVTHPSEPNYFAVYAGSTFGVTDDGDHTEVAPTLASRLQGAGDSFVGFVDAGSPRKHNPWESFPEGTSVERDAARLPSDFTTLPSVSFVIPNLAHDMHDGTIAAADQWLSGEIGAYATWAATHNSLLAVIWDEDDYAGPNIVPAILYGDHITTGTYPDTYTHYDFLHTLLANFGLPAMNDAAGAAGLKSDIFGGALFADKAADDFTRDGRADILWRASSGDVRLWSQSGAITTADAAVAGVATNWRIAAVADVTGDGRADLVWRSDSGELRLWAMNGASHTSDQRLAVAVGANWTLERTGDLDGDGQSDLLWRSNSGELREWRMSNGAVASDVKLADVAGDWRIAGTGDFDGDGKDDLLWRSSGGGVRIWEMNGSSERADLAAGPGSMPSGWSVAGVGDFYGEGHADILWRSSQGELRIWDMNGGTLAKDNALASGVTSDWHVAEVADFNADGRADILWRSDAGEVRLWTMSTSGIAFDQHVADVGAAWTIASNPYDLI